MVVHTSTNNIKLYIENKKNATLPPLFSFFHNYLLFNIENKTFYHTHVILLFMYTVVNVKDTTQKGKVVQADKTLFQRLLVAADAGRDLDLKTLLCQELSPVPLSLADTAKNLRPSNKAALGKILE